MKEQNKAIKIVKSMIADGIVSQEAAEKYFPELKESEDERIRKELIQNLKERFGTHGSMGVMLDMPRVIARLAFQAKQKETLCDKCRKEQPSHSCQDITALGRCALEKQGEQKPADKVESKFEIGDIITNGKIIGKVDENESNKYHGWFGYDKDLRVHYADVPDIENWHKWTIEDAKDGDVLYLQKDGKEHIIIYKGVIKERFKTFVSAYCAYNGIVDAFCFADVSKYVDIAYEGIMPATKEQRDLLSQKMKEAGYVWDSEKKELKKISQEYPLTPDECIKSVWSEEDDKNLEKTIWYVEKGGKLIFAKTDKLISWLKKFRYRVQPQPKQEWSKEDEIIISNLIWAIQNDKMNPNARENFSNWLKSLRPQSKQELDEQIETIAMHLDNCGNTAMAEILRSCNLRPQKRWKPTEEQLTCLEDAVNAYHKDGYPAKYLTSLLNELKAL